MTLDEKLAEMSTRPRVIPATPADLEEIRGMHSEVLVENAALKVKVAELEEELEQPPTTPPGNPPKILNERFVNGVDWTRFYSNGETNPTSTNIEAPRHWFTRVPEGLNITWIAGEVKNCRRAELGMRRDPGTETPRRDPVGSERWYMIELTIPESYVLDGPTADEKRNLWQCHQDGSSNPPLAFELRNGTFRLVRSIDGERTEILNPGAVKPGIPCTKGVKHKLVVHTLWQPNGTGWVECWLDTLHKPKVTGKNCYTGDGVANFFGSYQPGWASFPNGHRLDHLIHRVAIGDHTNVREDFE